MATTATSYNRYEPIYNRNKGDNMATAIYTAPMRRETVMQQSHTKPNINEIVRRVRALRALSKFSGFSTNRSVGEMLERLTPEELVTVGEAFLLDPQDNNSGK